MKTLLASALIAALLIISRGTLSAADDATARKVYEETNGFWTLVSMINDGVETPAEELNDIQLELKDGVWTTRKGDTVFSEGKYTILSVEDGVRVVGSETTFGEKKGNTGKHISKNEGDKLMICHGPNDKVAPKAFASEKGSGNILRVWERVQK